MVLFSKHMQKTSFLEVVLIIQSLVYKCGTKYKVKNLYSISHLIPAASILSLHQENFSGEMYGKNVPTLSLLNTL